MNQRTVLSICWHVCLFLVKVWTFPVRGFRLLDFTSHVPTDATFQAGTKVPFQNSAQNGRFFTIPSFSVRVCPSSCLFPCHLTLIFPLLVYLLFLLSLQALLTHLPCLCFSLSSLPSPHILTSCPTLQCTLFIQDSSWRTHYWIFSCPVCSYP